MRIIEHGSYKDKTKQFLCKYCGCIFEANFNEYDYIDLGLGGLTPICRCPECKQQTTKEINYSSFNWLDYLNKDEENHYGNLK